jgi:hypothetical protein
MSFDSRRREQIEAKQAGGEQPSCPGPSRRCFQVRFDGRPFSPGIAVERAASRLVPAVRGFYAFGQVQGLVHPA